MKHLKLTLLCCMLALASFAQNPFQTAWSIPFFSNITPASVSPCDDGGTIALLNNFTSSIVIKTDANGQVQWSKKLSYSSNSYVTNRYAGQCVNGGYFVFSDLTDGVTGYQGYVINKLDASGNLSWSKHYVRSEYYEGTPAIKQLASGEFVVSMGLDQEIASFKTDANGGLLWAAAFREDSVYKEPGLGCAISNDGSILFVAMDSDGASTSLVKTSASGILQWSLVFDSYAFYYYPEATVNTNDGGDLILFSNWSSQAVIQKVDGSGNPVWSKSFNTTDNVVYNKMEALSNGNILLTGANSSSALSYCIIDQQGNVISGGALNNTASFQMNPTYTTDMHNGQIGVIGSFSNFNTSMSGIGVCRSNTSGAFGCLYAPVTVITATASAVPQLNRAFNTLSFAVTVSTPAVSASDISVLQSDFCELTDVTDPSVNAVSISAFPSPLANGEALQLNISGINGDAIISVYDATGKMVKQINRTFASTTNVEMETTGLSGGVYLVRVTGADEQILGTTKFIVK
jgi:hypothetical protein